MLKGGDMSEKKTGVFSIVASIISYIIFVVVVVLFMIMGMAIN